MQARSKTVRLRGGLKWPTCQVGTLLASGYRVALRALCAYNFVLSPSAAPPPSMVGRIARHFSFSASSSSALLFFPFSFSLYRRFATCERPGLPVAVPLLYYLTFSLSRLANRPSLIHNGFRWPPEPRRAARLAHQVGRLDGQRLQLPPRPSQLAERRAGGRAAQVQGASREARRLEARTPTVAQ